MLTENLPPCPACSMHSYKPGGAYIGGGSIHQWFTCQWCDAAVMLWGESGASYLIYTTKSYTETPSECETRRQRGEDKPAPIEWMNNVVAVTLRDWKWKWEAAKKAKWINFLPGFLQRHNTQETSPGCIRYHDLPTQDAKDEIDEYNKHAHDLPGFENSPHLPLIPDGVIVLRHTEIGWDRESNAVSQTLEVPPDPITVDNDAYFKKVFEEVGVAHVEKVQNRYHGHANEPWFQFHIGDVVFTMGHRKHVVSIHMESLSKRNYRPLRDLAARDNVTFDVDDRYGHAHVDFSYEGNNTLIHAWGQGRCIEYLKTMLMIASAP